MEKIKNVLIILLLFIIGSCSNKDKEYLDDRKQSLLQSNIDNSKLDSIIKCYFITANVHGKHSGEAYLMELEKINLNEIELIISSIYRKKTLNNKKPSGWHIYDKDTLLIYSPLGLIGIYDSMAYQIQAKISNQLYPDTDAMFYEPQVWKIIFKDDSVRVLKDPSEWMQPIKLNTIKFDKPKVSKGN